MKKKDTPRQRFSFEQQILHLKLLNKRRKLTAFIGAGVSASCGLPDWNQLKKNIEYELLKVNNNASYTTENIEDVARNEFGEDFNFVVAKALYNNCEIKISKQIKFLSRSGIERFVSFNFDDILEEAIKTEMIEHKVVLNGKRFNSNYNGLLVFHPHGYLDRYSHKEYYLNKNVILSKKDYDELYKNHYCITNLIQLSFLINSSVLFVGMSLNDPNIIRLLQSSRNIGAWHWHTAIMKKKETLQENKQLQLKLRSLGVDPLWISNYSQIDEILIKLRVSKEFNTGIDNVI